MMINRLAGVLRTLWEKVLESTFVRHVGMLTVSNIAGTVLIILQGVIVARILGPTEYGVAGLILSYPSLFINVLSVRSSEVTLTYLGTYSSEADDEKAVSLIKLGYLLDMLVAVCTILLVGASAGWAGRNVVKAEGTTWLIVLVALSLLPASVVNTSRAVLCFLERFRTIAAIQFLVTLVRSIAIIVFVLLGNGVMGVILGHILGTLTQVVLYSVFGLRWIRTHWKGSVLRVRIDSLRDDAGSLRQFILFNSASTVVTSLVKQMDIPLLGFFRNPTEVGYYRLARSIASMVGYLVDPLVSVAFPRISKLFSEKGIGGLKQLIRRYTTQVSIALSTGAVVILPAVPWLIRVIYGEAFLPSAFPAISLLVQSIIWLFFFWLRPVYLCIGRIRHWTYGLMLSSLGIIVLDILLVPTGGYRMMAIIHAIGGVLLQTTMVTKLLMSQEWRME